MISIERQQRLLETIGHELKLKVTAYAIGGTAMMFHGRKEATKDIDLVFIDEKSRDAFKKACEKVGYRKKSPFRVYGAKPNTPEMYTLGDERLDLFVNEIIRFTFSSGMQQRSKVLHEYGNLHIKVADLHDIIILKCATDRIKDKDDAASIINNEKIRWDILVEEAQAQVALGRKEAVFELGDFLESLKREIHLDIPMSVLDRLWKILVKQQKRSSR